ncbi:hypothetical protein Ancab_026798 [Ancistrocladus abbreviatus]
MEARKLHIPKFNMSLVLEMLQHGRISFVGDPMSRTQWETMYNSIRSALSCLYKRSILYALQLDPVPDVRIPWELLDPFSGTITDVVKNMTVPVIILGITSMPAFWSDVHVGIWNDHQAVADCSHWCLPGVPDMWNKIVLTVNLRCNEGIRYVTPELEAMVQMENYFASCCYSTEHKKLTSRELNNTTTTSRK